MALLQLGIIFLITHCLTFFWFHSSCCYYLWVLKLYLCSDFALNLKFCLVLLFQMYSDIFSSVPNVSVFHVPTFFSSPRSKHALFSMFQTCSVLHVPNLLCSLYSKLVLFSIFQTCSVLYIPNLYVVGHHFSQIYIVFSRKSAVEQICSLLWGIVN